MRSACARAVVWRARCQSVGQINKKSGGKLLDVGAWQTLSFLSATSCRTSSTVEVPIVSGGVASTVSMVLLPPRPSSPLSISSHESAPTVNRSLACGLGSALRAIASPSFSWVAVHRRSLSAASAPSWSLLPPPCKSCATDQLGSTVSGLYGLGVLPVITSQIIAPAKRTSER